VFVVVVAEFVGPAAVAVEAEDVRAVGDGEAGPVGQLLVHLEPLGLMSRIHT
jgi:hypothetical protein